MQIAPISSYAANITAPKQAAPAFKSNEAAPDSFQKADTPKNEVKTKWGWIKDTLSGTIGGKDFEVKQASSLGKMLKLSGQFDGKPVAVTGKYKMFSANEITGNIGDKEVNLKYHRGFFKDRLKGNFDGKEIDLKLSDGWFSRKIEGDGVDMRFKNKGVFSSKAEFKGDYNLSPELFPLLMAIINKNNQDEAAMIMLCL